jgi:SHS2 domain-containing protein
VTTGAVTFLDHTADVGFDVTAPSPEALFDAAARGTLALLRGEEEEGAGSRSAVMRESASDGGHRRNPARELTLSAPDPQRLLADWLRELLFLHEVERLDYESVAFHELRLDPGPSAAGDAGASCRLDAAVRFHAGGQAIREIKGVTYHEIDVRRSPGGWAARVIFDV